jgi:hypothetical protein
MGRALVAYYEATGDKRILDALTKVYSHFDVMPVPWSLGDVSVSENVDITLIPYGCTKFRISMFPIAKK